MTTAAKRRRPAASPEAPQSAPVGRPRKLSAEAIVDGALAIIDRYGADKLSIRSLAVQLKVQATAIYTHYDSLEEIESAVLDKLLQAVPVPDASLKRPLREQLIDHFVALRSTHALHPRVDTGRIGGPAWVRNALHLEHVLSQLAARGVDMATAEVAYSALSGVTVMSARFADAYRGDDAVTAQRKTAAALKTIQAPHVIQMMSLPDSGQDPDQRFRKLLGALIDRLLPASVARGGTR